MTSMMIALPFLLTLCTVFVVSDNLANSTVSGKYFWFYAGMGLVAIATLITAVYYKKQYRFSIVDGLVLLFAGSVYLSALVSNDASQNTTKLTLFGLLAVLYFCIRLCHFCHCGLDPQSPSKDTAPVGGSRVKRGMTAQRWMTFVFILTGLVEAVWGLRQLYGFASSQHGLFRLTGSFFNPGPYAGYLAVVFPMALHYCITPKSPEGDFGEWVFSIFAHLKKLLPQVPFRGFRGWGYLGAITCIAILLVLPAAMSRASWLAVVAGSAVVLYARYSKKIRIHPFHPRHPSSILRYLGYGAIVLFLFAAFTGMYLLKKDSADGRALTWKVSLQTVVKHPFGVGLGNFPAAYGETQAAYFASGQASEQEERVAGNPEYGFNEYLQILIESGIVSFIFFIGIIVVAFRSMIRTKDWGRAGSLTALLVFAFFSYPFSVLPFLIVFVFLIAGNEKWITDDTGDCHCGLDPQSPSKDSAPIRGSRVKRGMTRWACHPRSILLACLCLLIVSFCLYRQYPVYEAYKKWNTSRLYFHAGMYNDVAEDYEKLYPLLNDQIKFLFEYAQSLSKSDYKGMADQVRHDRLIRSNEVLRRAMQISCDPMLYNVMGKNYQAMKQYEEAEKAFVKSTQIVPSRLYPWYLLTKLYHEMGLPEKVEETATIVLTKEPKVQSPAINEMREEAEKLRTKN
jgi:O-antigen ligase